MSVASSRHFLQIPGPTNVPDRVLHAIANPTIDHRGPDFADLALEVFDKLRAVARTSADVVLYPSSGTGAWEAALVNTLSPGDAVLMYETGHFAEQWSELASSLGLRPETIPGDWRSGVDPAAVEQRLRADTEHRIKAVAVVHNETSTGVVSDIPAVRAAIDAAGHPALLLVDTISSLGSMDYRHDEWGVDVTISCSQKGLMLPPGIGLNVISAKALLAAQSARLTKSYWDWQPLLTAGKQGYFRYTPPTNMLFGLREALSMLLEEGLDEVYARHDRHAAATRAAVRAWGLEILCRAPGTAPGTDYSSVLTAVLMPGEHDADHLRQVILEHFDTSLGAGLSKVAKKVFRIGHLGAFNDATLLGTLGVVEAGLRLADVPHRPGGVTAAIAELTGRSGE
ncbi:pyridoxal-phosphate-dependent aminotransferase family protein [Saccharopolyspora flava]|uniref:Tritium exchange subunit n=1 Tax=Saccharopolyspora flava TaxID=95161 RepID=A0A1I6UIE5_9PSEU|nr:aminotransferase class V-fold PLP-dependent enzyme [Saccharopolyspora flava]SFT01246.1 alanine-glyoxylate transaminase / serine-glyoxylate transaminase / serine-pyruvate transaminase [Saccharopolyspora flava]